MSRRKTDVDNLYTVYMHRHKNNGKAYIGCTKKPLNRRFEHGTGYKKCSRFWEAICEYGFDAFEHIIISSGLTKDEAYALEEKLVNDYDTMNPEHGYNLRRGGYHNIPCPEVGKRISESKMGHEVTPETREKIRKYILDNGHARKVIQKTLDGDVVRIFDSITDAANAVGAFKSNIWAVCVGKKPTCKNYKWEYHEEVI